MANEQNLIPNSMRTPSERRENARKAGIASGEARRKKKTTAQLVNLMLNSKLSEENKKEIKVLAGELDEEDLNVNSMLIAGQIKSAINGNTNAFEILQEYQNKAEKDDNTESTYTLPITDITKDFVEVYRKIHEAFDGKENIREIVCKGGRGSIKSNFWAGVAEETIYQDPQAHVVYTRRYKTDLRGSVYNQFMKTIIRHGKLDDWEFTTAPMMAKYKKTGQCVLFVGADKPISLKSYNLSFGYVKLLIHEECDEMAGIEQMDNIEDTFLRSDTPALDIKVFNPPKSANNFMNNYVLECANKPTTYVCHSYYYNVPVKWLGQRFFDRAEWFKENKPKYYANNYLGEVTGTGGTIFENIEFREITDEEIKTLSNFYHGIDWGYEHKQVFIESSYDEETDVVYATYEVAVSRCKQDAFARKIEKYKNVEIIADSADPDKIADYNDWGFDVIGATKRWKGGGRDYSWEWLRSRRKIVIDSARTPNLAKEMQKAEFEQLKDGTFSSKYPTLDEDSIMSLLYSLNRVIINEKRLGDYEYEESEEYEDE